MLVDGISKQACVWKNAKERKKDCHLKVYLYIIYFMQHKRSIKGPTLLGIIKLYH